MRPDPRKLAAQVGETMYAADRASREFVQIELVSCEPGCAVMRMTVRECIEFLKPARLDDVLTCEGREQLLQGRYGVYDMKVSNQRGEEVAMVRGKSAQIPGHVIAEPV